MASVVEGVQGVAAGDEVLDEGSIAPGVLAEAVDEGDGGAGRVLARAPSLVVEPEVAVAG